MRHKECKEIDAGDKVWIVPKSKACPDAEIYRKIDYQAEIYQAAQH
jgi:hypothetical protein